jgi:hypothetical protein
MNTDRKEFDDYVEKIKQEFVKNFGERTAQTIEYDTGVAFLDYMHKLPDRKDAALKNIHRYL